MSEPLLRQGPARKEHPVTQLRRFIAIAFGLPVLMLLGLSYVDAHAFTLFHPSEEDYLASLRENSKVGCSTFSERGADVVFIGDSHSYSGWDFNLVAQILTPFRVSACTLGGLYLETATDIVIDLANSPRPPRVIVYGLSPRQFLIGRNKSNQIAEHRRALTALRAPVLFSHTVDPREGVDALRRHYLQHRLPAEWKTFAAQESALRTHGAIIESLQVARVDEIFETVDNASTKSWREFIRGALPPANLQQQLHRFCRAVASARMTLVVAPIPESPRLEAMYTREIRRTYNEATVILSGCAARTLPVGAGSYGIDNRYFLNRSMNNEFPYSAIGSGTPTDLIAHSRDELFDLDHMNLIGAHRFTTLAAPTIRQAATKANGRRTSVSSEIPNLIGR